ncbi:MAG: hypothetical protein KDK70_26675 [Myxococcales bacterium]|nr:hypothetical protein [Myxococcales bacterium]
MMMALAGLGLGCGDDTTTGSGTSGSGSSSGDETMASGTTVVADGSTGMGSGSAESDESSSSGEPPLEVTVEGDVIDFVLSSGIGGAQISIYDDPSITAMADETGFFSIGTFPPNTGQLFVLAPSAEYWGAVIPVDIGMDPLQEDQELTQISTAIVDTQIMQLMNQMPATPNLDEAIIIVRLLQNSAVMEGDTIIEMDPPPVDGTYYAPDAGGTPILNQNAIQWGVIPVVVYFNIPDSTPGDITFMATHPMRECTILYPELPTIGQHMTLVDVDCPPAS